MKKSFFFIVLAFLTLYSCKKDEKTPTTPTNPSPNNMTSWEASLVGQWKLKRSEHRSAIVYPSLSDSTVQYTNHFNFQNSQLNLMSSTSFVASSGLQMYNGIMGLDDGTASNTINWCGLGNTISFDGSTTYFIVKYLTTDSLVLDQTGGALRLYFNKTSDPPMQNNIESQLIGGVWQLITQNGLPPSTPTYKEFIPYWYNDNGYFGRDSIYNNITMTSMVSSFDWEVLFPSRPIPILLYNSTYAKITNLTPTSMTIESFNPFVSNTTIETYVYSR